MAKTKSVIAEKKNSSNKDLSNELIGAINSQFKGSLAASAHYLADPEVLTDVKQWIPSGCTPLDFAISNRAGGGFPSGRICEIVGWEASGKSLLVAYALSNTQKAGGIAVYIDTESAVSSEYLTAIGVDIDSLIYIQQEALEDIFATIETIIEKVRLSDKKRLVTIVVDSIMGATTHKELEAEWGKDGYATDKALILSKAMRKITGMISKQNICLLFTNQLRQKLGVMFGDNFTTSGGKALAFHSSVRIKLESIGKITVKGKGGNDEIVGIKTRAKVIKNRLGPPLRSVEYNIFFNSGIDDYSSWFELLKNKNVITTSGPWNILKLEAPMQIVKEDSEVVTVSDLRFYTKDFQFLVSTNKELKNYLYSLLCKYMILEYKINEDFTSDDVTIDSNVEE
mgnify:FL=1